MERNWRRLTGEGADPSPSTGSDRKFALGSICQVRKNKRKVKKNKKTTTTWFEPRRSIDAPEEVPTSAGFREYQLIHTFRETLKD